MKQHFAIAIVALPILSTSAYAADAASFSQGRGAVTITKLYDCAGGRPTPVGTVKSSDGKTWTVPASNQFQTGVKAPDLYNPCNDITPRNVSAIDLNKVPVVEVDAEGEVITGYLMADNYFELYVNGRLVGVDAVPFTPFNSSVVRFKVKRPYTLAVKLIDWEENPGLGTEQSGGAHHPGDGGFIARFSDGTLTDNSWKAQSFYIAPLNSPADVTERGNVHDTGKLGRTYPQAPSQARCGEQCFAAHYPVPANWTAVSFNDADWPAATLFTHAEMGLDNQRAYTSVNEVFGSAQVVWSMNLVYDNVVLARKTVK